MATDNSGSRRTIGVLLAAGRSTRFGAINKLTHPLEGQPMVVYALQHLREAGVDSITAVVGHQRALVMECLGPGIDFAIQEQQMGTGHAVATVLPRICDDDEVVVLFGDCPFIDSTIIQGAIHEHRQMQASVTIVTAELKDPLALGRLERDDAGRLVKIREGKQIRSSDSAEIFAGLSVWNGAALRWALPKLPQKRKKADLVEQDLPDAVELLSAAGHHIATTEIDEKDATAPNVIDEFAAASDYLRRKTKYRLANSGVDIRDFMQVRVDHTARVDPGVTLEAETQVLGLTQVGSGSNIGPGTTLKNCTVGRDCIIGRGLWEGFNFPDGSVAYDRMNRQNMYFHKDYYLIPEEPKYCFVLTPFAEVHIARFEAVIRPTLQKLGYVCEVVSDTYSDGSIIQTIWENINRASLIVAEISEPNPNVWYELGLAHALGKPVLMLREERAEKLPFDVQGLRAHFYSHEKANIGLAIEKYVENNSHLL